MKSLSVAALLTKLNKITADVEQRRSQVDKDGGVHVVIYDVATGQPLPGYEPATSGVIVYLPDNGRDRYKDGYIA